MISRPAWLRVRRGGDRWWVVGASVVALLATAIGLTALALHEIATPWEATIVLTAASHYLMWAAFAGVACAVVARRWITTAAAGIASALVLVVQIPPLIGGAAASSGPSVLVLQANLQVGAADPAALVKLVREHRVDVLATEELTFAEQARLVAAGLPNLLPYRYTAPLSDGGGGLGIWSRYRLSDAKNLPDFSAGVLTAQVMAPVAFTFVAVHLSAPYAQPIGQWRSEIARLHRVLTGLPQRPPVLVAGDFNATVDHAQFRALLGDGYEDAAEQAGAGYLPTYPTDRWWGPLIGIDHVLTRSASAGSAATYSLPGSDHRALLVHAWLA